jgi:hypothetical protein
MAEHSTVSIGAFCARHIEIKLQGGKSFGSFLESLATIVIGGRRGICAGLAEVISGSVLGIFRRP